MALLLSQAKIPSNSLDALDFITVANTPVNQITPDRDVY